MLHAMHKEPLQYIVDTLHYGYNEEQWRVFWFT